MSLSSRTGSHGIIHGYITEIKSGVGFTTFINRHGFDNDIIDVDRNSEIINLTETSDPRISSVAPTIPAGIETDMITDTPSNQDDIQIGSEIKLSRTIESLSSTISQVQVENANIDSIITSPRVDMNITIVSETTSKLKEMNKECSKKESYNNSGTSDIDSSLICLDDQKQIALKKIPLSMC